MSYERGKQQMLVTGVEKKRENGDLIVYLTGRSSKGKRVVKEVYGTEPYFFAPKHLYRQEAAQRVSTDPRVKRVDETGYESYDGVSLVKVVCEAPSDVGDVRGYFDVTYEADVVYERRCTADYDMAGYIEVPSETEIRVDQIDSIPPADAPDIRPRVLFADIEVRVPDTFDDEFIEDAPNEVTAICGYDSFADDYTLFCLDPELQVEPGEIRSHINDNWEGYDEADRVTEKPINFKRFGDESELLQAFVDYCAERRFDLFTGWNFVDFDIEYLTNRMHSDEAVYLHAMSDVGYVGGYSPGEYIDGVPTIDMMNGICEKVTYGEWASKSLDYVCNEELGVGKVEGDDVQYDSNRTKFMAYNIVDVMLMVELDVQTEFIEFWMMLAEICAIPPYLVGTEMYEVEGYLFNNRTKQEILPDREDDKQMDTISGGMVLPPFEGVQEWVGTIDLKSLYPSSMITCNISRETMTTDPDEADIIVPDIPLNYEEASGDKITEEDISWELGEGSCVGFSLSEEGIMSKYVKQLFSNRADMKAKRNAADVDSNEYKRYDRMQSGIKVVMNCFTADTEVLTPNGVQDIAALELGDEVYSLNPDTGELEVKPVVDTTEQENLYGEVYDIAGQSVDFSVTPNHRMYVENNQYGGEAEFVEAQDLNEHTRYRIPSHDVSDARTEADVEPFDWVVDGEIDGRVRMEYEEHGRVFRSKLPEPVAEAAEYDANRGEMVVSASVYRRYADAIHEVAADVTVQYDRKHSTIPVRVSRAELARFVGWFAAEGYCEMQENTRAGVSTTVSVAQKNETQKNEIIEILQSTGATVRKDANGVHLHNRVIGEWLKREIGQSAQEKQLPEWIFALPVAVKEDVFECLIRGDGDTSGNAYRYTTASESLRDDVLQLAVECGYKPDYSFEESPGEYDGVWRIYCSTVGDTFSMSRNGSRSEHTDTVYCVTVEDNHTVLAGRNGKFQWVGQSFFGVSDHPYFRLSADGVGAAITAVSRYVSWVGVQEIEQAGYSLVYGDTDSLLMSLPDHPDVSSEGLEDFTAASVLEEVNETVNSGLSRVADDVGLPDTHPYIEPGMHGTERHLWMYEPEKVYRRFLMTGAKKRYAGSIVWKEGKFVDDIDITGYDFERASTPEISKEVQREIIERVLRAESFESLSEYVDEQIDRLENIDAPLRKFAFPGVLNKPPSEYPNRPIKRATIYSNRHLNTDWGEGDSPWYVYVDETPMSAPNTDVIAVSWDRQDLPTGFEIDVEKHIDKTIRGPIDDIVDVAGFSWSELRTGRQEQTVFRQSDSDSPEDIFG